MFFLFHTSVYWKCVFFCISQLPLRHLWRLEVTARVCYYQLVLSALLEHIGKMFYLVSAGIQTSNLSPRLSFFYCSDGFHSPRYKPHISHGKSNLNYISSVSLSSRIRKCPGFLASSNYTFGSIISYFFKLTFVQKWYIVNDTQGDAKHQVY
jgi:hypothetical protein